MNLNQINREKRKLEARYVRPLRAIFKQMNKDALALYKATGNIPANSIAQNYTLEFTKVIRDAMRESIKTFGFIQRSKHKKFNVEKQLSILDYQIEHKEILFSSTEDELEQIDNDFASLAILFVASESERQALYIQDTNAKELTKAQENAVILAAKKQARLTTLIEKLRVEINTLTFQQILNSDKKRARRLEALIRREDNLQLGLDDLVQDSKNIIARTIEEDLGDKEDSRADLIAQLAVGISESWAREEEVAILALTLGLTLKKTWVTSFINSRPTHIAANNQTVGLNEYFTVGGSLAKHPRDPSLPIQELANCHCSVTYS